MTEPTGHQRLLADDFEGTTVTPQPNLNATSS